jgi:hypothetical protein
MFERASAGRMSADMPKLMMSPDASNQKLLALFQSGRR